MKPAALTTAVLALAGLPSFADAIITQTQGATLCDVGNHRRFDYGRDQRQCSDGRSLPLRNRTDHDFTPMETITGSVSAHRNRRV